MNRPRVKVPGKMSKITLKSYIVVQMSPVIFSRVLGLPVIGPLQVWHWLPVLASWEILWLWQSSQMIWPCMVI